MRRSRITITLQKQLIDKIDHLINKEKVRNRSHAIEFILNKHFQGGVKKAVILAGGQGTKLRPYTYEIPKSLLPIKGKPLLTYTFESLKKHGIEEIIICTGYLGEQIKKYFGDGKKLGIRIRYSDDAKPLQTGGALLKAKHLIGEESFLVIHGDILTNFQFQDLISFHLEHKPVITVAKTAVENPKEYGQLQLHGTKLVQFINKGKFPQISSHLINCGIYACSPELFNYLTVKKPAFLLEEIIEKLIPKKKVNGFVFEKQWFDVGCPENYERAIKEFQEE